MNKSAILFCVLLSATTGIAAELNPVFQNHAVLQCATRVPVWGAGRDGEKITVTFDGQVVSTVATNGSWEVWLEPMKADATPQRILPTHPPARHRPRVGGGNDCHG